MSATEFRANVNYKANQGRVQTYEAQSPAYAASIALATTAADTIVKPGTLTGALSLTIGTGSTGLPPFIGDRLTLVFTADTTGRTVTFSTGFTGLSTILVSASTTTIAVCVFNGTAWNVTAYLESRSDAPDVQTPAYAATIALTTTKKNTFVNVAQLTGALTINATVTSALINDRLYFTFSADGTNRVVTFGTNMKSSGTLTITASKFGAAEFIFDGTNWIQLSTTATA